VAGSFALLLVFAAVQLDQRRCAEVARARAETLAQTAGAWLDGDAHAGLGNAPEQRLSDLGTSLGKLVEASDYDGAARTLRPSADEKANLTAHPERARADALELVIQTGAKLARHDVDYRPEMKPALIDGKCVTVVSGGTVSAYAPVPDSWGATPAIVWVEGP